MESMRYLRIPIAARRTIKLTSAKFKLKEMEILLGKVISSRLPTVRKIDAVKAFVLPAIDFLLLNGEVGRSGLRIVDKKIRGMTNPELKTQVCETEAISSRSDYLHR
jgi:hypothetical protein